MDDSIQTSMETAESYLSPIAAANSKLELSTAISDISYSNLAGCASVKAIRVKADDCAVKYKAVLDIDLSNFNKIASIFAVQDAEIAAKVGP